MIRKTILAATLALSALSALPSHAGGQFTLSFDARNSEQAQAIRSGLALYALHRDIRSNGHVTQEGAGNAAALLQRGTGHRGYVVQRGDGHQGALVQSGRNNTHALIQSGRDTRAKVVQRGKGRAGLTIVHGW